MLDEQALRRPTFVEGVKVVLADGQGWELPRPVVRMVPAENDVGWRVTIPCGDSEGFRKLFDEHDATEAGFDRVKLRARMGRLLLLANYDLTDDQVGDLMQFAFSDDDQEGLRILTEVSEVVLGNAPKPSGGGDE